MASKKPVTAWVITQADDYEQDFGTWSATRPTGIARHMKARRFVAIDSLPVALRAKVRKACK